MSGNYLLDTDTAIQILSQQIDLNPYREKGDEFYLCHTVLGELFYGAERSAHPKLNQERIQRLAKGCPVLETTRETAQIYGAIKGKLMAKGRPIPENDYWIAATALQYGLVVASRDPHFDDVDELKTWGL